MGSGPSKSVATDVERARISAEVEKEKARFKLDQEKHKMNLDLEILKQNLEDGRMKQQHEDAVQLEKDRSERTCSTFEALIAKNYSPQEIGFLTACLTQCMRGQLTFDEFNAIQFEFDEFKGSRKAKRSKSSKSDNSASSTESEEE